MHHEFVPSIIVDSQCRILCGSSGPMRNAYHGVCYMTCIVFEPKEISYYPSLALFVDGDVLMNFVFEEL